MNSVAPSLGLLTVLRDSFATTRYLLFRSLILLLFLGLVGGSAAAAADVQSAPVTSVGPGPQFAIDDFDGDLHPDIASIQAAQSDFSRTDYWIQLQLSAVERQSILVVGPVGGLLIEARDVNGDHAVDLLLSTAWLRHPVAILLNDGHGSFSRVEPNAFPEAFTQSTTKWNSASDQAADAVGVPPQSRTQLCLKARASPHFRLRTDSIPVSGVGFILRSFLISHAGRAPPSEVRYL